MRKFLNISIAPEILEQLEVYIKAYPYENKSRVASRAIVEFLERNKT